MDWYPRYPRRYRRDTLLLSLAAHGAYNLIIDWYMEYEQAPPDDDVAIARIIGCSVDEWTAVKDELMPYFKVKNGRLTLKRCEKELSARNKRRARRTASASTAAQKRWKKADKKPEKQNLKNTKQNNDLHATRITTASPSHSNRKTEDMRPNATGQDRTEELTPKSMTNVGVNSSTPNQAKTGCARETTTEHDGGPGSGFVGAKPDPPLDTEPIPNANAPPVANSEPSPISSLENFLEAQRAMANKARR